MIRPAAAHRLLAKRAPDAAAKWLTNNLAATTAFDEAKHPRDAKGEFSSGSDQAPVPKSAAIIPLDQRRTFASMPSYYRQASKTSGIPQSYTGSKIKELPVSSFRVAELVDQKPKGVTRKEHEALKTRLKHLVVALEEPTVAAGMEPKRRGKNRGDTMIPAGTPSLTVKRAYTHGALRALHGFGVARYDYSMSPALQEELKPLEPFMRYTERRVLQTMHATETGRWHPYRKEFGIPFGDKRTDKVTGEIRLRVQPRHMIKAVWIGGLAKAEWITPGWEGDKDRTHAVEKLAKAFDPAKHPREHDGQWAKKTGEIVGRYTGGAVGGAAGQAFGAVHGPAIGEKVGRISGRVIAALHDRVNPAGKATAWARPFAAEQLEMRGGTVGRAIGTKYGRAVGGVAFGVGGYLAGGKAGALADKAMRRRRARKAGRIEQYDRLNSVRKLAKAFEEAEHPRDGGGQFSSGGGGSSSLAQPAQLAGGAVGAGLLAGAVGHIAKRPVAVLSRVVGNRTAAAFRLGAHASGAMNYHKAAQDIVSSQAKLINHGTRIGTKALVGGGLALASSLAGDYLGDYGARRIMGVQDKDDEYRHASLIGMGAGMLGMMLGHKAVGTTFWRGFRNSPIRRSLSGLGGAVTGAVATEAGGNLIDEKGKVTDMVATLNRRTVQRIAEGQSRA